MPQLAIALEILEMVAAAANATARAKAIYDKFKEQALRDKRLTPEEAAYLDARMEEILASPAQQPSGR